MIRILTLSILAIILIGCGNVNTESAQKTLRSQGMTEIKLRGYSIFGCDRNDNFRTKFTAKDVNGNKVSGTLCSGIFKGMTVRYD